METHCLEGALLDLQRPLFDKEGTSDNFVNLDLLHPNIFPSGRTDDFGDCLYMVELSCCSSTSEVKAGPPRRPGQTGCTDCCKLAVQTGADTLLLFDGDPGPRQYGPRQVALAEQSIQFCRDPFNIGSKNPPGFCLENLFRFVIKSLVSCSWGFSLSLFDSGN